jgi:phosphomannomutase/phosphoglucomutase
MKMREMDAILGGEMSGHIFFNDRWFGFDDGIYTGARMLEIISNQSKTSSKLFNELPSSFSSPEINIMVDKDGFQHEFMKKFIKLAKFPDAEITTIDGLRADFEYGWGLVRASNTMPYIVMRFEADTKEKFFHIKNSFVKQILNIDSTIEIPNEKK